MSNHVSIGAVGTGALVPAVVATVCLLLAAAACSDSGDEADAGAGAGTQSAVDAGNGDGGGGERDGTASAVGGQAGEQDADGGGALSEAEIREACGLLCSKVYACQQAFADAGVPPADFTDTFGTNPTECTDGCVASAGPGEPNAACSACVDEASCDVFVTCIDASCGED